tara:strand:+ start:14198 stop:14404 length:207 start_codon:yes stop_codon:yes gene_type:complete
MSFDRGEIMKLNLYMLAFLAFGCSDKENATTNSNTKSESEETTTETNSETVETEQTEQTETNKGENND